MVQVDIPTTRLVTSTCVTWQPSWVTWRWVTAWLLMIHHPCVITWKVPPPPMWQNSVVKEIPMTSHKVGPRQLQVWTKANVPHWHILLCHKSPKVRTRLELRRNTAWSSQTQNILILLHMWTLGQRVSDLVRCGPKIEAARTFKTDIFDDIGKGQAFARTLNEK